MSNIIYNNKTQTTPYDPTKFNADDANQIKAAVNSKLDSVAGKSLVADTEIARLASVTNQDISGKVNQTEYNTTIIALHAEDTRLQALIDTLSAGEGVDLSAYLTKTLASTTYQTKGNYLTAVTWSDVSNKPALFSGSFTDLTNKPTLFDGAYASLSGKPALFSGSYTDLTNKPTIPSITGLATETFVTSRGYLTTVPTIDYTSLSNKPVLFSGAYADLTGKPTIPSIAGLATEIYVNSQGFIKSVGTISYNSLIDKPTIPSLTGYATESFVTGKNYLTAVTWTNLSGTIPLEKIPVLTKDKLPDASLDINEFSEDSSTSTIKINKAFLDAYIDSRIALSGGGTVEPTTPAAPIVTADDTANTLVFSSPLGNSEILVSENNGTYTAYSGSISVGDVARAAGYWKAKIKAAQGRNESAVANSPAFTTVPVSGETTLTAPVFVQNMADLGAQSGARATEANALQYAKYREYLPSNATGYISCLCDGFGINLDLRDSGYNNQGALFYVNMNYGNGRMEAGYRGSQPTRVADDLPKQAYYMKATFNATTILIQYSADGVTWIGDQTTARTAGQDLYVRPTGYFIPSSSATTNGGLGVISQVKMSGFLIDTTLTA